jgi:hypothetical protein
MSKDMPDPMLANVGFTANMFNDTVSLFISDVKKPPDVLKAMV